MTHVDKHAILTGIVEHGYSGIEYRSKVQHLIAGIKTKVLDPVKTQIMESATLRNDFDACVNLYKDFIEQSDDLGFCDANISSVHNNKNGASSGSGGGKGAGTNYEKVIPDNSFPDQYCTGEEYQALNDTQKKGLKLKISIRGHKPKVKHSRPHSGGGNKLNMELSKRSIADLSLYLASQTGDAESTDPTSETYSKDEEYKKSAKRQKSNRTNKALTRRKN